MGEGRSGRQDSFQAYDRPIPPVYCPLSTLPRPPPLAPMGVPFAPHPSRQPLCVADTTLPRILLNFPSCTLTSCRWYDIHLSNFTGSGTGNRLFWMDCAKDLPCHHWTFANMSGLLPGRTDHPEISYVCNNFVLSGDDGLDECHPSSSTLEQDNHGTLVRDSSYQEEENELTRPSSDSRMFTRMESQERPDMETSLLVHILIFGAHKRTILLAAR